MANRIQVVDGVPSLTVNGKANGEVRPELYTLRGPTNRRAARATYDAARSGTDLDAHWAHADAFDSDSANSRPVRQALTRRSRYEKGSNGYYDGILKTHVNMLVGVGPKLRMLTNSLALNQAIEFAWEAWSKRIQLRRKLWCMGHSRFQDGESFGLLLTNPGIPTDEVQLDLLLLETEQCQTPYIPFAEKGYIDGIRFDDYNNVLWYDILPEHPGKASGAFITSSPVRVSPRNVLHWFKLIRPNGHRGIPDLTSTLNVGATSRRHREATVTAAETAASIGALLETQMSPSGADEPDPIRPLTAFEIQRRMMMALPMGWQARQLEAQHPNAAYAEFHRQQLSEQARPLSMPYNAAACDSSTYSFASGKLDTLCYRADIDVEREDCNDLVLSPLFYAWFNEWTRVERLIGVQLRHQWDWPAHPVIDAVADAQATRTRLETGVTTLRKVYSEAGMDFEDELVAMAEDYGVSTDEMRKILLNTIFPASVEKEEPAAAGFPGKRLVAEFCPTGEGGGIDPSCPSSQKGKGGKLKIEKETKNPRGEGISPVKAGDTHIADIKSRSVVAGPGRGSIRTYDISYDEKGLKEATGKDIQVVGKYAKPELFREGAKKFYTSSHDSRAAAIRALKSELKEVGIE